jgi:hypothetical protein
MYTFNFFSLNLQIYVVTPALDALAIYTKNQDQPPQKRDATKRVSTPFLTPHFRLLLWKPQSQQYQALLLGKM